MVLKWTQELENAFQSCSDSTLSPKETHLVTFAAQLSCGEESGARDALKLAVESGSTLEEIHRVACMCACTAGPRVQTQYLNVLNQVGRSVTGADLSDGDSRAKEPAFSLDESVFRSRRLCTRASLDDRMTHLVGLTACLASGCACASGHIVAARKARATNEELTRCACIAACAAGMQVKYAFLTHQQFVDEEDGERFWADAFA